MTAHLTKGIEGMDIATHYTVLVYKMNHMEHYFDVHYSTTITTERQIEPHKRVLPVRTMVTVHFLI